MKFQTDCNETCFENFVLVESAQKHITVIITCSTSFFFSQGKALGQMLLDFRIKNVPDILPSVIEPNL